MVNLEFEVHKAHGASSSSLGIALKPRILYLINTKLLLSLNPYYECIPDIFHLISFKPWSDSYKNSQI